MLFFEIKEIEIQFIGKIKYFTIEIPSYYINEGISVVTVHYYNEYKFERFTKQIEIDYVGYETWGKGINLMAECVCHTYDLELVKII